MNKMFAKEYQLANQVRDYISRLKPIRFTGDALKSEILKGGQRADDIITLILYVEDLSIALKETIGEAEDQIRILSERAYRLSQSAATKAK